MVRKIWVLVGSVACATACDGGSNGTGTSAGTLGGLTSAGSTSDTDGSGSGGTGQGSDSQTSSNPGTSGPETSTSSGCACEAGEAVGCIGEALEVCDDDCMGTHEEACTVPTECVGGACELVGCKPGSTQCAVDGRRGADV